MRQQIRNAVSTLKMYIPFILATLLIAAGICDLAECYITSGINGNSLKVRMVILALTRIIGGAIILFDPNKNAMRSLGFYTLFLGINRGLGSIESLISPNDIVFIYGLVMVVLSINMMISGYFYLSGTSRGRNTLMITMIFMIIAQALMVIVYTSAGMYEHLLSSASTLVLFFVLIMILDTQEVKSGMQYEQINESVRGSRHSMTLDPRMEMDRNDALQIRHALTDRSSWNMIDDGWIESETVIKIPELGGTEGTEYIRLQKWKNSDKIFGVLSDSENGTFIQGRRFSFDRVVDDGKDDDSFEWMRLFDEGILLAQISVSDTLRMRDV